MTQTGVETQTQISVQSSGFSNKHDYQWQSDRGSQYPDAPYRNIPGLKQSQLNSFSLVFSRSDQDLFLLISGLDSGRKDIRHRQIRNTVLWNTPNPNDQDEAIYRHIAALALRDRSNLDRYIQQAIVANKDNDYGYSVNSDLLEPETIIQNILSRDYLDILNRSEELGILPDRYQRIAEIAEALEKHRLPTSTKNLIVINDRKTQDIVEAGKLYLSFGDILEDPSDPDAKEYATFPEYSAFVEKTMSLRPQMRSSEMSLPPWLKLLVFLVIIALLLATILSLNSKNNDIQSPILYLKDLQIKVAFDGNKPSQFSYILTGKYDLPVNAPAIEEVKLIDSQQQQIATGKVNTSNRVWQISYSSRSRIDCKQQLSIQGFDREGKSVGEAIENPSLCSDGH